MRPVNSLYQFIKRLFVMTLMSSTLLSGCADMSTQSEGADKTFSSSGSYDSLSSDADGDTYGETALSPEDQDTVQQLINTNLGALEDGDLTDGSTLVAGPAYAPEVILSCQEGVAYVSAGVATGVLATVLAASGIVAAGGGVVATSTASVPVYATAGGLIGFGLSSSSWTTCIGAIASVGLGLIQNGYFSAARGLQSLVLQWSGDRASSGAQSAAQSCRQGSRQCNDMTGRYKNTFCNPLNRRRDQLGINVHEYAICARGGLSCQEVVELARLAAGCWRGRQAVTDRCFGGRADDGHRLATEYAEGDFFSCVDLSFDLGCGDPMIEDRLFDQAESAYPECL